MSGQLPQQQEMGTITLGYYWCQETVHQITKQYCWVTSRGEREGMFCTAGNRLLHNRHFGLRAFLPRLLAGPGSCANHGSHEAVNQRPGPWITSFKPKVRHTSATRCCWKSRPRFLMRSALRLMTQRKAPAVACNCANYFRMFVRNSRARHLAVKIRANRLPCLPKKTLPWRRLRKAESDLTDRATRMNRRVKTEMHALNHFAR